MFDSNPVRHFLFIVAVGTFAAVLFVLIQPLWGMDTITGRHAQAYVTQGGYSEVTSMILAWLLHTIVSVIYASFSIMIYQLNHSKWVSLFQIMALGWVSTLIATPANVFAIKTITSGSIPDLSTIPPLNGEVGPKLWLHVVFFALVLAMVHIHGYFKKNNLRSRLVIS